MQDAIPAEYRYLELPAREVTHDEPRVVIGAGAFGSVLRGAFAGHPVALKHVPIVASLPLEDSDPRGVLEHAFWREADTQSHIRHEGVAIVHGTCQCSDPQSPTHPVPCRIVVMELADSSLSALLRVDPLTDGDRVCFAQVLSLLRQAAGALKFVHARGVLHLDIKPANVLVFAGAGGALSAKLSDFGLTHVRRALFSLPREERERSLLGPTIRGTPGYMDPDFFLRNAGGSTASDVYSFGVMLCECVARKQPFKGYDLPSIMKAVRDGEEPIKVTSVDDAACGQNAVVGARLRALISQCWSLRSSERPTMEHVERELASLEQLLQAGLSRPVQQAVPPTPPHAAGNDNAAAQIAITPAVAPGGHGGRPHVADAGAAECAAPPAPAALVRARAHPAPTPGRTTDAVAFFDATGRLLSFTDAQVTAGIVTPAALIRREPVGATGFLFAISGHAYVGADGSRLISTGRDAALEFTCEAQADGAVIVQAANGGAFVSVATAGGAVVLAAAGSALALAINPALGMMHPAWAVSSGAGRKVALWGGEHGGWLAAQKPDVAGGGHVLSGLWGPGTREQWTLNVVRTGAAPLVALLSPHNRWLSASSSGFLAADKTTQGPRELFELVAVPGAVGCVGVRATAIPRRFVSARHLLVNASAEALGATETFLLIDAAEAAKHYSKSGHPAYVAADPAPPSVRLPVITRAVYGAFDRWMDVTARVRSLEPRGPVLIDNAAMGQDPAHGVEKHLRVSWTRGGVAQPAVDVKEGSSLMLHLGIPAALVIAVYGHGLRTRDVTAQLRATGSFVVAGGLLVAIRAFRVTNEEMGGDVAPGEGKTLRIDYILRGAARSVSVAEGDWWRGP